MVTVKEPREQAKSYRLRGYSTLQKPGLIRLIAEACTRVLLARAARAWKTGRYPALTRGDVDNPHKKAQRIRELRQLNAEVTAALRANKYAQTIKAQPRQRLKPLRALSSRLKWQTDHWADKEPLARKIIRKGPKLLAEIKAYDGEEKGRHTITWKQFRGLEGAIADKIMLKVETLERAFYLRYSYTYRLRNIENGKVMLFHKNLGGSPSLITNLDAAREWLQKKDGSRLNIDKIERPNTKWSFAG